MIEQGNKIFIKKISQNTEEEIVKSKGQHIIIYSESIYYFSSCIIRNTITFEEAECHSEIHLLKKHIRSIDLHRFIDVKKYGLYVGEIGLFFDDLNEAKELQSKLVEWLIGDLN